MPRLLGDRAVHDAGRRDAGASSRRRSSCPAGPRRSTPGRARPRRPGCSRRACRCFGICYGHQVLVRELGGTVERTGAAEYGGTPLRVVTAGGGTLLAGLGAEFERLDVARRHLHRRAAGLHGDRAAPRRRPPRRSRTADRGLYGVQFHPEVMHTEHGTKILRRFLEAAGCRPTWTMLNIVEEQTGRIREQVGGGRAICGLSGGVDSAVAAALVQRAIGDRLTCVFVDHGLLRKGEAEQVEQDFVAATGVNLHVVDASAEFLAALRRCHRPRGTSARSSAASSSAPSSAPRGRSPPTPARTAKPTEFLVQGTLYPDVVESGGGTGTANIKSHHNVGGLPDDLKFQLVEPLRCAVQGRGAAGRRGARAAAGDRVAPAVPRSGPGHQDHRRGHRAAAGDPARGGRDRARGADRGGTRPDRLAVPGGAARRRALRRRAGRRQDLRAPGRAAAR